MRTPCRWKIPSRRCKGQMVRALADDHLGHEPWPGQSAGDRLGRLGGHRHVLLRQRQAAFRELLTAGIFLAEVNDDKQRRGPPVELLAGLRRQLDQVLRAAQRRLLGLRKIVGLFLPLDLVGNSSAAVPVAILGSGRRCGRRFCGGRRRGRVGRRLVRARLGIEQHSLPRIELLARCCRRAASAASACGALAAPNAHGPFAALPSTARPTASAPPGRRAAGRDRAEARRPCSCPLLRNATHDGSPLRQNFFRPLQPARST